MEEVVINNKVGEGQPSAQQILDSKIEEKLKKRSRKISTIEGSSYSISDGFGLKYISPFAIALGANNTQIGFLSSIPGLLGNLAMIAGSKAIEKFSRKKIVAISVFTQAFMWLAILAIAYLHYAMHVSSLLSAWLLIFVYTIFTLVGAFPGPAWNSWMKDIVTEKSGAFFGRRNMICGSISLVSMLIAGGILDYFNNHSVLIGFTILFLASFVGRFFSGFSFTKMYEPKLTYSKEYYFSFWQFIKKMAKNNFGKFVIFISLLNLATSIAGPFFIVYQLRDLQFSYLSYTLITMSNLIATLVFMPLWGKFGDRYGTVKVMKICGFLIPFLPIMYIFSMPLRMYNPSLVLPYIILAEAFSGFMWGGFNLSASNFIYDAVSKERMALCTAYFNVTNSIGVFIGASLGGLLASNVTPIFGINPLLFVFALSGIARFIIVLIMSSKIKEVREVEDFDVNSHIKENMKRGLSVIRPSQFWKTVGIKNVIKEE